MGDRREYVLFAVWFTNKSNFTIYYNANTRLNVSIITLVTDFNLWYERLLASFHSLTVPYAGRLTVTGTDLPSKKG